ncbi:unnamed protein product [Debaryomyces fabryi]|nr:unnamed protein product [Debaryomyces fabryi]
MNYTRDDGSLDLSKDNIIHNLRRDLVPYLIFHFRKRSRKYGRF